MLTVVASLTWCLANFISYNNTRGHDGNGTCAAANFVYLGHVLLKELSVCNLFVRWDLIGTPIMGKVVVCRADCISE